ncbi:hypothetical protein CRM22_009252 [Opisthorchis felineus]|uniref:Amino acid transporter n=1 Tax=Opisthorchis felineus TaxID=147828 RepID=A0A4S2L9S3_OPIFE|nr:hypothetical protein CRM22_009252 [Opisthorchis felineus]TGZ59166.1 hypothetical protein CRM22_009252 [Opisthorchis felineus]
MRFPKLRVDCCRPKHSNREPTGWKRRVQSWFRTPANIQILLIVTAIILAILIGGLIRHLVPNLTTRTAMLVGFPGELLMNMLKMLVIPLITSTLISGLATLDKKSCGKMGLCAVVYYVTTTLIAVILGIILVVSIRPGSATIKVERESGKLDKAPRLGTLDAMLDLLRNMLPDNIVKSMTHQVATRIVSTTVIRNTSNPNQTDVQPETVEKMVLTSVDSTNVLGLIVFSIAFGLCIGQIGERGKVVVDFFRAVEEVVMKLIYIIMWYAPLGIFFLVMGKILELPDLLGAIKGLGLFMATVTAGLIIHLFIVLTLIYLAMTRKNPYTLFGAMLPAFFTALGTASSSATLPITFRCLEERLQIDTRVTRFVLPIGATMNMDGTALYEAVASIFIAQVNEFNLDIGQLVTISVTATLAAIGAASVPGAGLVTMVLVLTSVGLPVNDISLVLAVDWLLDRFRTAVNVMGDSFGAGIVAHLCRKELAENPVTSKSSVDPATAFEGVIYRLHSDMELKRYENTDEAETRNF